MITAKQLAKLEATYRTASAREEEARAKRNAGIRQALAEGKTHAWIAEATDLSRGRINQIAQNESEG